MDGNYIKAAFKGFLVIVTVGFIMQAFSLGIYYYNRKNFAEKDYNKNEKERCEKVVRGEEGDLVDYSYCIGFLKWLDSNTNFND